MDTMLDCAIQYANRGLAVFPLIPRDKRPLTKNGFKDATTDIEQIKKWWHQNPTANIGIATGSMSGGLFVIDCDVDKEKGKDGYHNFLDWVDDHYLYLDDTWQSITGRGGYHIMFRCDHPVATRTNWLPAVDVRAEGGYIVAPPSIHPNGNRYEWEYAPEDCDILTNDDGNVECIVGFINAESKKPVDMSNEVPEGGRNDYLYRLACSYQGKGQSDEFILNAILDANKERCNPPLSEAEVRRIVESAKSKPKGTTYTHQEEPKRLDIPLTLATDIMNRDMPELEVFVGVGEEVPLLVEGVCILSAKSKLGKSWFSLDLCIAITKGQDFLGYKTKPCHTLYFDLETVQQIQKKRLMKIVDEAESIPGFYMVSKANLLGKGFEEQLEGYLEQDPEIGVVIVDVFQKIRLQKKTTEADYEYQYREIGVLSEIAKRHHISIILVTHDRKAVDPTDPFSNILGSTAVQGASDQMLVMYKKHFDDEYTKLSAKGRTIDGIVNIDMKIDKGTWTRGTAASRAEEDNLERIEAYKNSDIREGILKLASYHNGFEGTCTAFINRCVAEGIGIMETPVQIGMFWANNIGLAMSIDNIRLERKDRGTGSKLYKIYPSDGFEDTEDEFPE